MDDSLSSLTVHGIPRVASSRHFLVKAFWTLACVALALFLGSMLMESHDKFIQRATVFQSKTDYYPFMEFPAMTMCNTKQITKKDLFGDTCEKGNASSSTNSSSDFCLISKMYCDLDQFLSSENTRCVVANLKGNFKQYLPITQAGLELILPVGEGADYPFLTGKGVSLSIHPPSIPALLGESSILMAAGSLNVVTLKKSNTVLLKAPYASDCTDDGSELEYHYDGKYTVTGCRLGCLAYSLAEPCNDGLPFAMTRDMRNDSRFKHKGVNPFLCSFLSFNPSLSECLCRLPCQQEHYEVTTSASKWPSSKWEYDKCRLYIQEQTGCQNTHNITDEFIENHFLKVMISFSEFSNTTKEEMAVVDGQSLLSDIGGLMGLFLGASLFSLVEFIIVVPLRCIRWINSAIGNREEKSTGKQNNETKDKEGNTSTFA